MYDLTIQELDSKQKRLDQRKSKVYIKDLESCYDLAQIIKHCMVDAKETVSKYNNGSKRLQCETGRQRSVEDIYQVAKEQIPGITLQEVREACKKLVDAGKLTHNFCSTVRREVHWKSNAMGLTTQAIRKYLGNTNKRNPNYVRPKS